MRTWPEEFANLTVFLFFVFLTWLAWNTVGPFFTCVALILISGALSLLGGMSQKITELENQIDDLQADAQDSTY
jgi:hypothetical protein